MGLEPAPLKNKDSYLHKIREEDFDHIDSEIIKCFKAEDVLAATELLFQGIQEMYSTSFLSLESKNMIWKKIKEAFEDVIDKEVGDL